VTARPALVEVRDLVKHYRRRGMFGASSETIRAVEGVSFDIAPGETLGLVGESGCGKTTVGRSILRLEEPTEGSVRFDGTDVLTLPRRELRAFRRRMQIIFQDPYGSLNPRMRVGDAIAEGLRIHQVVPSGDVPGRVESLLAEVGLEAAAAGRFPHEFSGGQRQRIGIARALAVEPTFLVCDEPVSALDVSVQAQVVNLLVDLQQRHGLAYLFIAHDLAVVRQMAHRTAVMYFGRLVETGPTEDILSTPRHPYTQALLSAVPVPDPAGQRSRIVLEGEMPSPSNPPSGCPFHARCFHPDKDSRCTSDVPELRSIGAGRVACHHAGPPT
jgi:oligopeptide/dipeptide ABC transporter ATP-binding protein